MLAGGVETIAEVTSRSRNTVFRALELHSERFGSASNIVEARLRYSNPSNYVLLFWFSVSVSQQSSPRRSLIPQPTRQRSTSLSKSNERLSSPKLPRRVDSRTRLNTTDSRNRLNVYGNSNSITNLATRRQATKTPSKLSPIQGTPTKPEKTPQFVKRDRSKDAVRTPSTKLQKVSASPAKNAWNSKKAQEKTSVARRTPSKERQTSVTSPSKIPLKANRVSTNNLNPARFINITQPEKSKKTSDKGSKDGRAGSVQANGSSQSGKQSDPGSKDSQASERNSSSTDKGSNLDLIDLLRQTTGATGTSSVVTTTATTAVQPLHIDANLDKDASDKRNPPEKTKNHSDPVNAKSSSSNDDSATKQTQNSQTAGDDQRSANPQTSKSKPINNYRTKGGTDSRNDSPVPTGTPSSLPKNSVNQATRNFTKVNGTTSNSGSATQRSKNQSAMNDQSTKNSKPSDQKAEELITVQPVAAMNSTKTIEVKTVNDTNKVSSTEPQKPGASIASATAKQEDARGAKVSSEMKTVANTNGNAAGDAVADRSSSSAKANNVSAMVGAVNDSKTVNSAEVKRPNNHGSGTSVKSSAAMSVESIGSVRSTDTGVSVDTVRGVSSPREKTGMHVVKRPQEIETLSGNVMHLEQNGDPG